MSAKSVKIIFIQTGIAVGILILFLLIFRLMQEPGIYQQTLGKISYNYERIGDWNNWQINQVKKPYIQPTDENIYNWDADIYRCIRDFAYKPEGGYTQVRHAFFPLFPLVWKITGTGSRMMGFINYGLFAVALILLSAFLVKDTQKRIFLFCISVLMPSVIIYLIPYSEAVFTVTMAVAVAGLFKRKYWLYFTGMMAMSMTRPAVLIFIAAFGAVEFISFLHHRNFRFFLKEFSIKILPLLLGFAAALAYQNYYTVSWIAVFKAQQYWPGSLGIPLQFGDWSVEGFGISVFALFFICLPAFFYLLSWTINAFKNTRENKLPAPFLAFEENETKRFLWHISLSYMAFMLLYTMFYREGSLHSFFRFILASPFFYIILFILPEKLNQDKKSSSFILFFIPLISLIIFLSLVEYGGSRISYNFMGMYAGITLSALVYFGEYFSFRTRIILLFCLATPCILWHTFLYNSFISNGWIFT